MGIPQQVTVITLGARDMPSLRAFYVGLGWQERSGSDDHFAAYDAGTVRLALYPIGLLGEEAAPGEPAPPRGWNGITLAGNVASTEEVDAAYRHALASGARAVGQPVARAWGGYSGYFADPEGNRWEIAWAPGF